MKRLIASLAVLVIAATAFAQTSSAPAIPTIAAPDIEKLLASIPADLWPSASRASGLQAAAMREWSAKNADGNKISFPALPDKPRPAILFKLPNRETIIVTVSGASNDALRGATSGTIGKGGVMFIEQSPNNLALSINIK